LIDLYCGGSLIGAYQALEGISIKAAVAQPYLLGHVDLQGRPAPPDKSWVTHLTLTLIQMPDNTAVETREVNTDDRGDFRLAMPIGLYDICIKADRSLSQRVINVLFYILGDANMDGVVDTGDITKVKRIYLGLDPPTPAADANQDGVINAGDITKVRRIYMGLDPVVGMTTEVDFGTLIEGDANNDDVINNFDMVLVEQAMGTMPGDPNWNDACDFNRDGIVDENDMALLQDNFHRGDLDDDGYVTQADSDILRDYLFGHPISEISPLSEAEFLRRADVNKDGVIDMGDWAEIKQIISGV
jgi:hypothetical protein